MIARTFLRLGLHNVLRVGFYKLRLKGGWRPKPLRYKCPSGSVFESRHFVHVSNGFDLPTPTTLEIFGWHKITLTALPDWHSDPFGRKPSLNPDQDWFDILKTMNETDIKPFWELSRFYWLPQFSIAARKGDGSAAERMEKWLQHWITNNKPFCGINWACGQEAAIRLMNLALSALILDNWREPSPIMKWLIETHTRRIKATFSYALGQDNNHGTAEACALFIAGTWGQVWAMPSAARIERVGRKWINDRVLRMIQPDGSPCQYSTTYHRANLEGFCMARLWSVRTGNKCFDSAEVARVIEGARWLHRITDQISGDAPNLGSNDSSHLFSMPQSPYRDFRPTVGLVATLFSDARPWAGYSDARLETLRLPLGKRTWAPPTSSVSDNGGFAVLRNNMSMVMMRYPRFKFRPSHADALHIDLWVNSINLFRDGGTFSYNAGNEWMNYFSGIESHNTVQFDDLEQMPRISRFLFGNWLETTKIEDLKDDGESKCFGASYTFRKKTKHHRRIALSSNRLLVNDLIKGFKVKAIVRWRLVPGEWEIKEVKNGFLATLDSDLNLSILVTSRHPLVRGELVQGWESLRYLEKTQIPVFEIETNSAGLIKTTVDWRNN